MEWITTNGGQLWLIFTSIVTVASLIVKLTPSTKDDNVVSKIMSFIALNKK